MALDALAAAESGNILIDSLVWEGLPLWTRPPSSGLPVLAWPTATAASSVGAALAAG